MIALLLACAVPDAPTPEVAVAPPSAAARAVPSVTKKAELSVGAEARVCVRRAALFEVAPFDCSKTTVKAVEGPLGATIDDAVLHQALTSIGIDAAQQEVWVLSYDVGETPALVGGSGISFEPPSQGRELFSNYVYEMSQGAWRIHILVTP